MSFFFKPSRPKTPTELVKAIKDSLVALDTKTVVEVKALEKVRFLFQFLSSKLDLFVPIVYVNHDLILFWGSNLIINFRH